MQVDVIELSESYKKSYFLSLQELKDSFLFSIIIKVNKNRLIMFFSENQNVYFPSTISITNKPILSYVNKRKPLEPSEVTISKSFFDKAHHERKIARDRSKSRNTETDVVE